ncbi:solute carrier family 15 member 2-like, partial [Anarrhichthys ocellatus]|uniref:solute carrier family 15 member 2-like n=1 Tax=Anarrhichthys ocellatus TaxID=433405 RepID=UPI0012ED5CDD
MLRSHQYFIFIYQCFILTLHPSLAVVFIGGSGLYKRNPPQGNILLEVCNCIGFAIKNRWKRSKYDSKRKHWLDWAEEKYSKRLIQEIKMVLKVLVLYIPLPMFWALFDQQGSRWTLQATRMNMAFGDAFVIKPDQMQMLNALLILLLIPVFDLVIYPLVGFCRINITPLRKMATGMIFASLAFIAATLVEVHVVVRIRAAAMTPSCCYTHTHTQRFTCKQAHLHRTQETHLHRTQDTHL